MEFERPGKAVPRLVMRPFIQGSLYHGMHWFDNRHYVISFDSLVQLVPVLFGLIGFFGLAWFIVGSVAQDKSDILEGALILLFGGAGCFLTHKLEKLRGYVLFDRERGFFLRSYCNPDKTGKLKPMRFYPFSECEARTITSFGNMGASQQSWLSLYHPSLKHKGIFSGIFSNRSQAIGFWAFLLQYMAKEAPLPDVDGLWPYPNRTSGVGNHEQWEAFEKRPDFIDPLDVYWGHWQFDPPEDAQKVYDLYEPRNMEADVAPVSGPHDSCRQIQTRDITTPLPKRVLRPFHTASESNLNDKTFVIEGSNFYDRFHYLAAWTLMCAGLALFAVSGFAAWPILGAALAYFIYFRRQRREKGTVFHRRSGKVILHCGLRLTPLVLDFDQCQGRLVRTDHREGFSSYQLELNCPGRNPVNLGTCGCVSLEYLLGFWSFIVQYMDKGAGIPDVEGFKNYPDRAKGFGPWKTWAAKTIQPGFVDPFVQWLDELAKKPRRDVTGCEKQEGFSNYNYHTDFTSTGKTD